MTERELLQNVLTLLNKAEYKAQGAEVVQIADVIQRYGKWAFDYLNRKTAVEAANDE